MNIMDVKRDLNLKISRSTVFRASHLGNSLEWKRMRKAPAMTAFYKKMRLEWFIENVKFYLEEWQSIIFSDEKKFNLDGIDGNAYYWHSLRHDERMFSTRQHGGGSVMICACFFYFGRSSIAFLDGRQDSECYVRTMENYLLPMAHTCHDDTWIYQQDDATIHTSKLTISWFNYKKVASLKWPARSPDLNPIENLWGILSNKVYANNRVFNTMQELKDAIETCWHDIPLKCLRMLIGGMPNRCGTVIKEREGPLKY